MAREPDRARHQTSLSHYLRDVEGDIIRFFSSECLERLCARFDIVERTRFEEGPLPKRLLVTLPKRSIE